MAHVDKPAPLFVLMADSPDYYSILQVHPDADREVIDAAYRKLAAKYHPDVNSSPDASEKMKQLNEAYEVLSDPEKRAAYDRGRVVVTGRLLPGQKWRNLVVPLALIVLVIILVKLKTLGLMLLAFAVIIWLLWRKW